jgi:hypothetical protein
VVFSAGPMTVASPNNSAGPLAGMVFTAPNSDVSKVIDEGAWTPLGGLDFGVTSESMS